MSKRILILLFFSQSCVSCVYHDLTPPATQTFTCDTISWAEDIQPTLATSCALSGCHNGISRLDWRDHDEIKKFTTSVRSKILDRSMPPDSTLSQHHIDIMVCWLDMGAPEN